MYEDYRNWKMEHLIKKQLKHNMLHISHDKYPQLS